MLWYDYLWVSLHRLPFDSVICSVQQWIEAQLSVFGITYYQILSMLNLTVTNTKAFRYNLVLSDCFIE